MGGSFAPNHTGMPIVERGAKLDYLRLSVLGLYRSLSYIQFDVPGFPPFQQFPEGTEISPEMFV